MLPLRACLLSAALLLLGGLVGAAQPSRPSAIRILTPADHDLYVRAFDAGSRGDWVAARNLAAQGHDPLARQLLEWRYVLD